MVLRFLFRFLMSDRIVDKLAESYPFRRAAKWAVFILHKAKAIKPDEALSNDNLKNIASKIEENLKKAAENLEKKNKSN